MRKPLPSLERWVVCCRTAARGDCAWGIRGKSKRKSTPTTRTSCKKKVHLVRCLLFHPVNQNHKNNHGQNPRYNANQSYVIHRCPSYRKVSPAQTRTADKWTSAHAGKHILPVFRRGLTAIAVPLGDLHLRWESPRESRVYARFSPLNFKNGLKFGRCRPRPDHQQLTRLNPSETAAPVTNQRYLFPESREGSSSVIVLTERTP